MATGLELRLWWSDHLLAEHFFHDGVERKYRLGSANDVDFALSSSVIGTSSHELVRVSRHGRPEVRVTRRLGAVLHRPGAAPCGFEQMIANGFVSADDTFLTLAPGERLMLQLGSLTAELTSRAAPRRVARPLFGAIDFTFANTLLAAGAAAVFFIIAAVNSSHDQTRLDDWASTSRTQMVHVLISAVPKSPPLVQARASHDDRPSSPSGSVAITHRPTPARPGPHSLLENLRGGGIGAIFGAHGIDHELQKAMGGLRVADAFGNARDEGLGLRGTGGLEGPGNTIGARGIEPRGRHQGAGVGGSLGPAKPHDIHVDSDGPQPDSALDRELIRQVIHSHRDQIRYCYE